MSDTAPTPERFVDDEQAAEFLSLTPRRLKELARSGVLPAYPLGDGVRRVWRFRLSDLAEAMSARGRANVPRARYRFEEEGR